MSGAPSPPPRPDPVKVLRYRSLEHRYRAEVALDAGDFAEFQSMRHLSRLEAEVADEKEAKK